MDVTALNAITQASISRAHIRHLLKDRQLPKAAVVELLRNGTIQSLTAEQIQQGYLDAFPKMRDNKGGAMLLRFSDTTLSLRPDIRPNDKKGKPIKYLYQVGSEDTPLYSTNQPWIPPADLGKPVCATEGLFDALAITYRAGIPCAAITAPSHLYGSHLPKSVKVYISDSDVPFHHSSSLLPVILEQAISKGDLKLAHFPRSPVGDYAYTDGRIGDECKWGADEWCTYWGEDATARIQSIIDNAKQPRDYINQIIDEQAAVGIDYSEGHTAQLEQLIRAAAAAFPTKASLTPILDRISNRLMPSVNRLQWAKDIANHRREKIEAVRAERRVKECAEQDRLAALNPGASLAALFQPPAAVDAEPVLGDSPTNEQLLAFIHTKYGPRLCEMRQVPFDRNGDPIKDVGNFYMRIASDMAVDVGKANACDAVMHLANTNRFNPIADYFADLTSRPLHTPIPLSVIAGWFGIAEDDEVSHHMLQRHLVAAVRRGREPGFKHDAMLVLQGPQGVGKSTAIEKLAPHVPEPSFISVTDAKGFEDREFLATINSAHLVEIAECDRMMRMRTQQELKSFLSRTHDRYCNKYERHPEEYPRRCVIFGTTNETEFLHDPTGARRFWIARVVQRLDWDSIDLHRDYIWRTAVHWFDDLDTPHCFKHDDPILLHANQRAESARACDPWEVPIMTALENIIPDVQGRLRISQDLLITRIMPDISIDRIDRFVQMRITGIINAAAFRTHNGKYRWQSLGSPAMLPDSNGVVRKIRGYEAVAVDGGDDPSLDGTPPASAIEEGTTSAAEEQLETNLTGELVPSQTPCEGMDLNPWNKQEQPFLRKIEEEKVFPQMVPAENNFSPKGVLDQVDVPGCSITEPRGQTPCPAADLSRTTDDVPAAKPVVLEHHSQPPAPDAVVLDELNRLRRQNGGDLTTAQVMAAGYADSPQAAEALLRAAARRVEIGEVVVGVGGATWYQM